MRWRCSIASIRTWSRKHSTMKSISKLEPAGEENCEIAKRMCQIANSGKGSSVHIGEIPVSGLMTATILHHQLAACARFDRYRCGGPDHAQGQRDRLTGLHVRAQADDVCSRQSPHHLLRARRAVHCIGHQRIGDHAKNLVELVIYIVMGNRGTPHFIAPANRSCRSARQTDNMMRG